VTQEYVPLKHFSFYRCDSRGSYVDGFDDQFDQSRDRIFPVVEEVDPLLSRKFIGENLIRGHILDPNRNDDEVVLVGERKFLLDLLGVVGVGGEDQDHDLGGADRLEDLFPVILARLDVAQGNPASEPAIFERRTDGPGDLLILRRIGDEYLRVHDTPNDRIMRSFPDLSLANSCASR